MSYILLILLIILYLFELIDIFNALSVRVIGAGYRPDRRGCGVWAPGYGWYPKGGLGIGCLPVAGRDLSGMKHPQYLHLFATDAVGDQVGVVG